MTRAEMLAERANKLSPESKKALRYLLPSGFPYNPKNFLILKETDETISVLLEQVIHLENIETTKEGK